MFEFNYYYLKCGWLCFHSRSHATMHNSFNRQLTINTAFNLSLSIHFIHFSHLPKGNKSLSFSSKTMYAKLVLVSYPVYIFMFKNNFKMCVFLLQQFVLGFEYRQFLTSMFQCTWRHLKLETKAMVLRMWWLLIARE